MNSPRPRGRIAFSVESIVCKDRARHSSLVAVFVEVLLDNILYLAELTW